MCICTTIILPGVDLTVTWGGVGVTLIGAVATLVGVTIVVLVIA